MNRIVLPATIVATLVLQACGGGGETNSNSGGSALGTSSVAYAVVKYAPPEQCAGGGITVYAGIDTNGNAVLDESERTTTQYVCNGTNGQATLVAVVSEPAGDNCASGGHRVNAGLDLNANGVLDAEEVTGAPAYICNGAGGVDTLVAIVPDTTYCPYEGLQITSGFDTNDNGSLDAGEAGAPSYVCNGAPGPGITWVNVTGTSVQAEPNKGYLANSEAEVSVSLPAAPALGDIVQISGVGSGGWRIYQKSGQFINTINIGGIGAQWEARATVRDWIAVASSADGTRLAASAADDGIYTSSDGGVTWTARMACAACWGLASSADGTRLVAANYGGKVYTSADSGVTWTERMNDSNRNWFRVASSADGVKLVATVGAGQIYTSVDSGATWTPRDSIRQWDSVASSADGTKLVASSNGYLYTSTDSGVTWTARLTDASRNWATVASSADGNKLVAVARGGQIYTSTNAGAAWTPREGGKWWFAAASSADGTRLVAAAVGGEILTSTDSGVTWTVRGEPKLWYAVASSADGTRLLAAETQGKLYVSKAQTATGITGTILGDQYETIALQYTGGGQFIVISHEGDLTIDWHFPLTPPVIVLP